MNLFKLKKDGKTVGYLKIEDGDIWFRGSGIWYRFRSYLGVTGFDEALPYVCDDKNGDKVFAGDKVIRKDLISPHKGIVTYRPNHADYIILKDRYDADEGYGNFGINSKYIEYIKEKP